MTQQGPSARHGHVAGSAATRRRLQARAADRITSPADLRSMSPDQLTDLAAEIREFLVEQTSKRGGHLGPNLGIVELTMALHLVFDSPSGPDPVRHRSPGLRAQDHHRPGRPVRPLRTRNGLSGYPSRAESEHDWIENSHASTSLSYADGLAKAFALRKETDRTVVAVIGDGALTGGMAWEALNNIAGGQDRPLVIVLNDNGRSYAPTTGGMAQRMAAMRLRPGYERMLGRVKHTLPRAPVVGRPLYSALHAAKSAVKDWFLPQTMFADLGLKYLGPIDGHDVEALRAGAAPGPGLPRAGAGALRHAARARATRPRNPTTPSRCIRRPRSTRPPASRRRRAAPPGPTCSVGRWWWPARNGPTWWRSPRRCAGRPGWCRSPPRSRTGSSTSGSPSSMR